MASERLFRVRRHRRHRRNHGRPCRTPGQRVSPVSRSLGPSQTCRRVPCRPSLRSQSLTRDAVLPIGRQPPEASTVTLNQKPCRAPGKASQTSRTKLVTVPRAGPRQPVRGVLGRGHSPLAPDLPADCALLGGPMRRSSLAAPHPSGEALRTVVTACACGVRSPEPPGPTPAPHLGPNERACPRAAVSTSPLGRPRKTRCGEHTWPLSEGALRSSGQCPSTAPWSVPSSPGAATLAAPRPAGTWRPHCLAREVGLARQLHRPEATFEGTSEGYLAGEAGGSSVPA